MAGWFERKKTDAGNFRFTLKAGNGEVILTSQNYASAAACDGGIASVQSNCAMDERYEKLEASDGRPYFNLKAGNHQIIGSSQMYSSAASRDNGIESVKTNGVSTDIRDV